MNLTKKLNLLDYFYEDIAPDLYLHKKSKDSNFILIDKSDNRQKEFTLDLLLNYLDITEINQIKLELIVDYVLTQQSLYYKLVLDDHLKLLDLNINELTEMEKELKSALKDITKKYVGRRLYIVGE